MRILFLTPQLPHPPRQGTAIRNYNLIRYLSRHHTIDLLSFTAAGQELAESSALHGLCGRISTVDQPLRTLTARMRSTLLSPLPDMALRLESPQMRTLVEMWVAETYDIVQVEGIEMAPYGLQFLDLRATRTERPLVIFDDHNCEYLLQKRNAMTDLQMPRRWIASAYSMLQWIKLRHYERRICVTADATIAVSQPDRRALENLGLTKPVTVLPNGIDSDAYAGFSPQNSIAETIIFTGKMDYRPNIDAALWFGQHVFPVIQSSQPQARFEIVGQSPHARLDVLKHNPHIEITGTVPEIGPYLEHAGVVIIPMRVGGGTRLKALEAMAAGKPIVTTSLGIEGIGVANGRELLIANSAEAFATAVLSLIEDQRAGGSESRRLGRNAHEYVSANYGWEKLVPQLEYVYSRVLQSAGHRALGRSEPQ